MAIELAQHSNGKALVIADMRDEELLVYREALVESKRHAIEELDGRRREVEAELQARIEKNGGRALSVKAPNGKSVTAELKDEWSPYSYDVAGLREAASLLPAEEATKIVKHFEEQVTVVAAHDEAGNPRSIAALITKYGSESEIGKRLSACMTRSHLGRKLSVSVE